MITQLVLVSMVTVLNNKSIGFKINAYSHIFVHIHEHKHARGSSVFQGIGEGGTDLI